MKNQAVAYAVRYFILMLVLGSITFLSDSFNTSAYDVEAQSFGRGYITSADELAEIRLLAEYGYQPYAGLVQEFMSDLGSPTDWEHGTAKGEFVFDEFDCRMIDDPGEERFINQQGGAQGAYKKMIAYYLTGDIAFAEFAREKILELTTTYGFGGEVYGGENECIRHLAFAIPVWIQAADLLEGVPVWSSADREQFSTWLSDVVYRKVAWSSYVRRNNWGAAGSVTASMIADYVMDTDIQLVEVMPIARELSPAEAYQNHNAQQLLRMNTVWQGDSRCEIWGIREHGGIPDELRRGDTGCEGRWLEDNDASFEYQIAHIDYLLFHAEYLKHRGDLSIYANINPDGTGSLLQAILFIIDNPINPEQSYGWDDYKTGMLSVSFAYYRNETILAEIDTFSLERGGVLAYAQLTHPIQMAQSSNSRR